MIDTAALRAKIEAGEMDRLAMTRAFRELSDGFLQLIDEKVGLTPDIERRHPELTGFLLNHRSIIHGSAEDSDIGPSLALMLESYEELVKRLA